MKKRSNIISRLLSLALCLCMVLAMLPVVPLVAEAAAATTVYFKPSTGWKSDGARFAAYFFGNGDTWVSMTDPNEDGIYECAVSSGYTGVIFCRMNPSTPDNNWNNGVMWNKTVDLKVPTNANTLFTITKNEWSGADGSWTAPSCKDWQIRHNIVDGICTRCGIEGRVVYFQNNWEWSDVKVYYWKGNNKIDAWPGESVSYYGEAKVNGVTRYYSVMTVPADVEGFIINGTNNSNTGTNKQDQTVTITLDDWYDGITYFLDAYTTETDGHHVCEVKDFLICKDFDEAHTYVDDVCTRCEETYCRIKGHQFGSELGKNDNCVHCGAPSMTIFFKSTWGWTDVCLHDWYEGTDVNNGWPGEKMSLRTSTQTGSGSSVDYFYLKVPTDIAGINVNGIKNDGSGDRDQSPDILVSELYHGACIEMVWDKVNEKNSYNIFDINDVYKCILGHNYGETAYKWADDYSTCTASRTCGRCGDIETAECSSDCTVVQKADCKTAAIFDYVAQFQDTPWAAEQKTQVTGDVASDVHTAAAEVFDNGDGTHTEKWTCCGAPAGEPEEHIDGNNDGRCDDCNTPVNPAFLAKVVSDLKGKIGLHYYFVLSDAVINDPDAYVQFAVADETVQIPVSQGKFDENGGYYVFTYEVSAKEMTEVITMQVFHNGQAVFEKDHTYNVRTYAAHILRDYDDVETRNLMEAMVNFGAAAQKHFGYNTDTLANFIQDDQGNDLITVPDYGNVKIEGYDVVRGQGTKQVKFYSASLILTSETTLRLFFTGPVSVTLEGEALEVKQRGSFYYVDVVGISAKDLDENVTVTINDGTDEADVKFNPMAYCQSIQEDTTGAYTAEMKDLVCALYLYNKAANDYFA